MQCVKSKENIDITRHQRLSRLKVTERTDNVSWYLLFAKPEIVCLWCLFGVKYNNWIWRSTATCNWRSRPLFEASTERSPFIIENGRAWISPPHHSPSILTPARKRKDSFLHRNTNYTDTVCSLSTWRHQFRQCALWFGNGTLIFHSAAQLYLSPQCVWRWMRALVLWRKESSVVNRPRSACSCLRQSSQPSDMSLGALC